MKMERKSLIIQDRKIKARVLTKEQIESSDMYGKVADRVDLLPFLEDLFDSNDTVFKYNEKKNSFLMIKADYLMKNNWMIRMYLSLI